jgi:hypothetical protein
MEETKLPFEKPKAIELENRTPSAILILILVNTVRLCERALEMIDVTDIGWADIV